jgi:hypothetical protein
LLDKTGRPSIAQTPWLMCGRINLQLVLRRNVEGTSQDVAKMGIVVTPEPEFLID